MKMTHRQRSSSSVLLGCLTVRWEIIEAYLGGGMIMPTFRLGKGFTIRERSSTSLATTPSLLGGSTIAPGQSQRHTRLGAPSVLTVLSSCGPIKPSTTKAL